MDRPSTDTDAPGPAPEPNDPPSGPPAPSDGPELPCGAEIMPLHRLVYRNYGPPGGLRRALLVASAVLGAMLAVGAWLHFSAARSELGYGFFFVFAAPFLAILLFIMGALFFRPSEGPAHSAKIILPDPPPDPSTLAGQINWEPPTVKRRLLIRRRAVPGRVWRAFGLALVIVGALCGGAGYFLYRTPVDRWGEIVQFSPHLQIYHGKNATREEAEALGRFVQSRGLGTADHPVTLRLARNDDGYELYVFTDPRIVRDDSALEEMRWFRKDVSREVFDGKPVTLLLCDRAVGASGMGALAEPTILKTIE